MGYVSSNKIHLVGMQNLNINPSPQLRPATKFVSLGLHHRTNPESGIAVLLLEDSGTKVDIEQQQSRSVAGARCSIKRVKLKSVNSQDA